MAEITIRTLHTVAEMDAAVDLQKIYWGEDMASIVPNHMLLSIARYGGHVHGAFENKRLIGMLIGFLGAEISPHDQKLARDTLFVMSKRMVVLPEYRGQKVGEYLKLAQRDYAIQHGIELVTWTFDPLLSRNAYLNLHKLGATGQSYEVDYFGAGASHPTLSADRLTVNWWVSHPQTVARLEEDRAKFDLEAAKIVSQTELNMQGLVVPIGETIQLVEHPHLALEIPPDFVALADIQPELGNLWRIYVRKAFQKLLAADYLATDFIRAKLAHDSHDRSFYIFSRDDHSYRFMKR